MTEKINERFTSMVSARRRESDRKQAATASTINRFLLDGTLISVSAIADAGGVSRNFIYSHENLLHQIEAARQTQVDGRAAGRKRPTNGAVGRAALQTELSLAHQTIKRLRQELGDLKIRHRHGLGEQLHQASGGQDEQSQSGRSLELERLNEENHLLSEQVRLLRHRVEDLTDDLTAESRSRQVLEGQPS